jgi:TusA-related sulfurtransferase
MVDAPSMPAPTAILPADDLDMTSGLTLLLERLVDRLPEGAIVEVESREPGVAHDLPAWCRFCGHTFLGRAGDDDATGARFRFRRGAARRVLLDPALAADAAAPPAKADPRTGFAPRGARVEAGAPAYPFSLVERDRVWADEIHELYAHAVANQWSAARDIAWSELPPAGSPDIEQAIAQIFTFLAENELSALYTPARFIARIHPYYAEVAMFIATQLADEARHIEAFLRRAQAGGQPLGVSAASSQASLKTLLEQEDFTSASFLLSVLGEGTFLDLLRYLEEHAPDPVTREIVRRARNDEARHVRFGVAHVRHHLASDPGAAASLAAAARDRARVLAGVTDVNPLVGESLAVLAAGSLRPADMRRGVIAARGLRETMHANRIKRLLACGFDATQADELSTLHTANFM